MLSAPWQNGCVDEHGHERVHVHVHEYEYEYEYVHGFRSRADSCVFPPMLI